MSSSASSHRLARSVLPLDSRLRNHRVEIARWALEHGATLNLDALTVILATKAHTSALERRPFTKWTTRQVFLFLLDAVQRHANQAGLAVPPHLGESLHTYLAALDSLGVLARGSSPVNELLRSTRASARLDADGRRIDHETGGPAALAAVLPLAAHQAGGPATRRRPSAG